MAEAQAVVDAPKPNANAVDPDREPNPDAPSPEDKDPKTGKTYTQADLDRITAKVRKNAQRDAELRFRREHQAPQPQAKADDKPEPKEEQAPKRDDFETHEDWQRADTAFTARKAAREENAKLKDEERAKERHEALQKAERTWHGKIEQAQAKLADFDDVLEGNTETLEVIGNSPMREFITESDIGPQIVYALCNDPAEAKRIAVLPKYKQAAAIDKIETELLAAAPKADPKQDPQDNPKKEDKDADAPNVERDGEGRFKPKKEPSKAPDPIEPVGARSANVETEPSDKDEHAVWLQK